MQISELQVGDIVFFNNKYLKVNERGEPVPGEYDPERGDYIDHMAIFAGYDSLTSQPVLIHAIENEHTAKKPGGVCQTTLRNLGVQHFDHEDGRDYFEVEYQIFRYHDAEFAAAMVKQAKKWMRYNVDYDAARLEHKFELEETLFDYGAFVENAAESYANGGKYRAIKYAARRDIMLVRPNVNGRARGTTCSQFIMMLFQTVELHGKVKGPCMQTLSGTFSEKQKAWPSNKYGNLNNILPRFKGGEYHKLMQERQSDICKEEGLDPDDFVDMPAINYWSAADDPAAFHSAMPYDPTIIFAGGVYHAMSEVHKDLWRAQGVLLVPKSDFTAAEKKQYGKGVHDAYCAKSIRTGIADAVSSKSPKRESVQFFPEAAGAAEVSTKAADIIPAALPPFVTNAPF